MMYSNSEEERSKVELRQEKIHIALHSSEGGPGVDILARKKLKKSLSVHNLWIEIFLGEVADR